MRQTLDQQILVVVAVEVLLFLPPILLEPKEQTVAQVL
jgi:hypothetical protein